MDTELLVDQRVEDGRRLISELAARGFEVSTAFWVRTTEDDLWLLYIVSPRVGQIPIGHAYGEVYAALSSLKDLAVTISNIKLIAPDNPIAVDALALRNRYHSPLPISFNGKRLGRVGIEEALIYPPLSPDMSRDQLLRTLTQIMNSPGQVALVTLRGGTSLRAIPSKIQTRQPGGIDVVFQNISSGHDETYGIDDILNIR